MMRSGGFAIAALLLVTFVAAQPAGWVQIAGTGITSLEEPALARSGDGSLHVVWRQAAAGKREYRHLMLNPDGKANGEARVIVGGWNSLSNPALLVARDGSLELLFGGVLGTLDQKDPYNNGSLYKATAPADGSRWGLQAGAHSADRFAYVGPIGATYSPDGQLWTCWPASAKLVAQQGLGNVPIQQLHDFGCCPYEAQIAADASTGEIIAGWYSNGNRQHGILLRPVAPVLGNAAAAPGSYVESGGQMQSRSQAQQVGLTGRSKGKPGVYLAYCSGYPVCTAINLWRYGDAAPITVAKVKQGRVAGAFQGPEGRLWIVWSDESGVTALRTNKAATRLGPANRPAPVSAQKVKGEGSAGPLDLFANSGAAILHTRVVPPLQVNIAPRMVEAPKGGSVRIEVTDVGDPVAGATIISGGQTLTTGPDGSAAYTVAPAAKPGKLVLKIQMPGYQPAEAALEIRPSQSTPGVR